MIWYLDCYSWKAMAGRNFPVNSYFHESAEWLAKIGGDLLEDSESGIDEVRITKETKGQCPIQA